MRSISWLASEARGLCSSTGEKPARRYNESACNRSDRDDLLAGERGDLRRGPVGADHVQLRRQHLRAGDSVLHRLERLQLCGGSARHLDAWQLHLHRHGHEHRRPELHGQHHLRGHRAGPYHDYDDKPTTTTTAPPALVPPLAVGTTTTTTTTTTTVPPPAFPGAGESYPNGAIVRFATSYYVFAGERAFSVPGAELSTLREVDHAIVVAAAPGRRGADGGGAASGDPRHGLRGGPRPDHLRGGDRRRALRLRLT
jgi:hypothetical protein